MGEWLEPQTATRTELEVADVPLDKVLFRQWKSPRELYDTLSIYRSHNHTLSCWLLRITQENYGILPLLRGWPPQGHSQPDWWGIPPGGGRRLFKSPFQQGAFAFRLCVLLDFLSWCLEKKGCSFWGVFNMCVVVEVLH